MIAGLEGSRYLRALAKATRKRAAILRERRSRPQFSGRKHVDVWWATTQAFCAEVAVADTLKAMGHDVRWNDSDVMQRGEPDIWPSLQVRWTPYVADPLLSVRPGEVHEGQTFILTSPATRGQTDGTRFAVHGFIRVEQLQRHQQRRLRPDGPASYVVPRSALRTDWDNLLHNDSTEAREQATGATA